MAYTPPYVCKDSAAPAAHARTHARTGPRGAMPELRRVTHTFPRTFFCYTAVLYCIIRISIEQKRTHIERVASRRGPASSFRLRNPLLVLLAPTARPSPASPRDAGRVCCFLPLSWQCWDAGMWLLLYIVFVRGAFCEALGSRRRFRPQASRYIPGSSP